MKKHTEDFKQGRSDCIDQRIVTAACCSRLGRWIIDVGQVGRATDMVSAPQADRKRVLQTAAYAAWQVLCGLVPVWFR